MANVPTGHDLIVKEASNKGVNPFDYKGIQPRGSAAPIGSGSNSTAPYEGAGYKSGSGPKTLNEKAK